MAVSLLLVAGCCAGWCFGSSDIDSISKTVSDLKQKVLDLQIAKDIDRQTIRSLESQLQNRHFVLDSLQRDRASLSTLDNQLRELKIELRRLIGVKEREVEVTGEVSSLWLQIDSLRGEIHGLRRELQSLRAKTEKDTINLNQARANQVSSKWVQRSLDELRGQIADVARAVNLSASLTRKQNVDSNLKLVRKDFQTFRKELEEMKAIQKRTLAEESLTQQDMAELRWRIQNLLVAQVHQSEEMAYIREDIFRHPMLSSDKLEISKLEHDAESNKKGIKHGVGISHKIRHHWKTEVLSMKQTIIRLATHQLQLKKDMQKMKTSYGSLNASVYRINHVTSRLSNHTTTWQSDHDAVLREVLELQGRLELVEEESSNNQEKLQNVSHSVAGIDKLHDSTMQLFRTMGSMEDKYDKNLYDLQKEMSKLEYVVSQSQSSYETLHENQAESTESLRNLKRRFVELQFQNDEDRIQLLSIQNRFANRSLNSCWDRSELTTLQIKVNGLEDEIDGIMERFDINKNSKQLKRNRIPLQYFSDCTEVPKSGVYYLKFAPEFPAKKIFCDKGVDGQDWMVIQRREDGSVNFTKGWSLYKEGFGNTFGEFWSGNEFLHNLTTYKKCALRIDMWDVNGMRTHAIYDHFSISSEKDNYRLHISGYQGTAGDALKYHNGFQFSTPDRNNHVNSIRCPIIHSVGWWYNHCQKANLNENYNRGIMWFNTGKQERAHLSRVEMKIK